MANDPAASRYQSSIGQAVNTMLALMLVALPFWLGSRRGWRRGLAAWMGGAAIVSLLAAIGVLGNTRAERELPAEWIAARLSTTATVMGRLSAELLSPSLLAATGSRLLLQTEASVSDCIGRSLIMGTDRCGGQATAWQWGANLGFQSLTVLAPESGSAVVMLTNTGGGIDAMVPGRGGYPAAKRIAARLLGIEGRWDLRP